MNSKVPSERVANELAHWRNLAAGELEETWGWSTPAGQARARRRGELIIQAAGLKSGRTALEVGCGTGLFTEQFAATGANIMAVDLSPELLEKAIKRNMPADRVALEPRQFEALDFSDPTVRRWAPNGFDAIIGSSVLHHLDIPVAIENFGRLLVKGGRIAFAEPNLLNPQVWMERNFRSWFPYVSHDETAIVRWRLQRQLESAGFTDVAITPFDWLHPATPESLMPLVDAIGRAFERLPAVREFAGSVVISATWAPR